MLLTQLLLYFTSIFLFSECFVSAEIVKDPTLCGRIKCRVPFDRKFKYLEKLYYQYHYRVKVNTNVGGKTLDKNESRLYIDSDVTLRFSSPCEGVLRFGNVSITHDQANYQPEFPDRAGAEFKTGLERHPLHFVFADGTIRELCPMPDDEIWSLNLKRGVLSMLQNTMLRFDIDRHHDELDVNGICETRYQLYEAQRTSLIIHKYKNLASCTYSAKHLSLIQSQTYHSPLSAAYALRQPLLASNSHCEITVDHNINQRVICHDIHRLKPFSRGDDSGAVTKITSSLELKGELQENPENNGINDDEEEFIHLTRTTLLYDHVKSQRTIYGELRTTRELLKSMCLLGTPQNLHENFSETFTKFIYSARMLDYQGLSQLYHRAQGICKTGRKHIIDALPFIGNNAAVNVMKDLIIKKLVDKSKVDFWVTSFTLIPRPDKYTIYALAPLLEIENEIRESQFILSYSSVIHTYSLNHGSSKLLEPVNKFMKLMEENVEKACQPRPYERTLLKKTLETLKAIGNAGIETDTLFIKLRKCITDESGFIPMEVRIAAIDAHRRLVSCEKSRDQFFLNYYRNFTIDAELRIASYLQVMRCPDYNVIKIIKRTLEEEEVNQVGSFVWSHLTNLLSSSSPTRIEIQSLLTDRDLGNKFNSDFRKFSRSFENSFFAEQYNFGANYQMNTIFSAKSYIPRTTSFNVTIDLFGESINFFEFNMRTEGLEFYAENLFGPTGPFSNIKIADHFRTLLRQYRSVKTEDSSNEYWKKIKSLPNVIDNNFEHPYISFGYKVFGNEIKFVVLDSDKAIRENLMNLNPWEKVKQILSGKEMVHYENTAMFLDSSYVVPTTTGLPIRLDVSGSAACNIKLSGILNSQKLMSHGQLEMNANIVPSVSVDITGTMIVDAFYKSAGLKLKSSIYSAGAVEADLKIESLKLARLSWKIPSHKMEVFSLTTDILLVTVNGAEYTEQPIGLLLPSRNDKNKENFNMSEMIIRNTTCTWSALDRLIGLKFCADYQFPNDIRNANSSYFLLNGSTKFRLALIKADPSANSYLLEYKWKRTENESTITLAFDTPGSETQREISIMVSFDAINNNVTVLLKSKGNSLVAQGTYKRTDLETFIDIGLNSNGTKHLDASVGYATKRAKYGFAYYPRLFLTINNERIVNFSGVIRNQDKINTSECDIDLRFETKNLSSHVFGYILKTNISVKGNVKVEYKFHEKFKDEVLQTEFYYINKSTKTLTYHAADMKLHSTAYPQLNIVSGLRYQHAMGHIELKLEINTSPHLYNAEKHKLTAQFDATYLKPYFQTDSSNVSAYVSITKPSQNIDVKIGINYYSISSESTTKVLIRYAPNKEITLTINLVIPRGTLLSIEGRVNLTIPNFNSMIVVAKIVEHSRNEYDLDFAGTWFSGHNITVRGTYYDRSAIVITNHDLKLRFTSPSFTKDILLNCKLYHDAIDLRLGLHVEQIDSDKYALIFNHSLISNNEFRTYLEGKYKNNTYSILSNINTQCKATIELHLHKWRDVYIIITGANEDMNKEYGIQINWDAKKDPTQKFIMNIQLNRFKSLEFDKNITAAMKISYPGRLITAFYLFALHKRNNYLIDTNLQWSPDKTIQITIDTGYETQNWIKELKLESQLLTPFENWKKTSLNGKFLQTQSDILASGSVYWQDSHHLIFDITGNVRTINDSDEWNANCGLISTVHAFQYITANLTNIYVTGKSVDTEIIIKYFPDRTIDVRSVWFIEESEDNTLNITGNLQLHSPLLNYRKGELKCHLSSRPNWKFYGAANFDLDKKKYSAHLIGDLERLKESMVQFNITTPFEKYTYIRGRFGLSEKNKHIVAEIATPAGPLGVEGICQLFTDGYNFNIKLLLATPVDIVQQALLIAKLNEQEADFRITYNNITAGFQGIWFYNNITNFHYSYILYTPLEGFHEIGAITKLIVINREPIDFIEIDSEFSLRVVELKAGLKVHVGLNPPPVVTIPVKPELKLTAKDAEKSSYVDDEENNLSWKAEVKLDAIIIETIVGSLDFEREGYNDKILASLKIPSGLIIIEDRFSLEDFFHIKNDFSLETPFAFASEVVSSYSFEVDVDNSIYLMNLTFNVKNDVEWIQNGIKINYTYQELDEGDPHLHFLKFDLKTPINVLKFVNCKWILEIDENYQKLNLSVFSVNSTLDIFGYLEQDSNYLDFVLHTMLNSPKLTIPRTKINAKKDFTEHEKYLEFIFNIEGLKEKQGKFRASWSSENQHLIKSSIVLDSWYEPLIGVEISILYNNSIHLDNSMYGRASLKHHHDKQYLLNIQLKDDKVNLEIDTPLLPKHLIMHGNLNKINNNLYKIVGTLRNSEVNEDFTINCHIKIDDAIFSSVDFLVIPREGSKYKAINLRFKSEKYGLYVEGESEKLHGNIKINLINYLNWDLRGKLYEDSNQLFNVVTYTNVHIDGNATLYFYSKTPWEELKKVELDSNLLLNSTTGNLHVKHQFNNDSGHFSFIWRLYYFYDLFLHLSAGHKEDGQIGKDVNVIVFYRNLRKAFTNIDLGLDINVDKSKWEFASNASLGMLDHKNIDAIFTLKIPEPSQDVHKILLSYHTNNDHRNISYVVGYSADVAQINYASDGSLKMDTNDIDGHLRLTWGLLSNQTLNNLFNVTFDSKEINLKYSLFTPNFLKEETIILIAKYDGKSERYAIIDTNLHYPAHKCIGSANILYESLININGTVNALTPLPNFSEIGCKFIVLTTLQKNKRFIELHWQNNSALIDSDYSYKSKKLDSNLDGYFKVEFPLNTRHIGLLQYGYNKRPLITIGYSELIYNEDKILDAQYKTVSESYAGVERENVEITIKNSFKPIGIVYINQYEYSAGNAGTNYPTVEYKEVNIYQLNNISAFNISGTSRIRKTHTGQEIKLTATHSNRTVKFCTHYNVLPGEFDQNSSLSLAKDAWLSYHINIINKTTEDVENQFVTISITYPHRNFTFNGSYFIANSELNSDASLLWKSQLETPRTLGASFNWKNSTVNQNIFQQLVSLNIKHPSFQKDVQIIGQLLRQDYRDLLNAKLTVDYSTIEEKLLVLSTVVRDESNLPNEWKYSYLFTGIHPKTKLDLDVRGYFRKNKPLLIETINTAQYKRSFLPEESGKLIGRLNFNTNEIELDRENNEYKKYFQARCFTNYPEYIVNGSLINGPEVNITGAFFLSLQEKLTWMMVNYTPDAIETLRMYGNIPDARNAEFNIWRTYDQDFTISDVSFYVRLNHSRLITSRLKWRPELKSDVTNAIKTALTNTYEELKKDINYWRHYIRSEIISAMSDVWTDSQEELEQFLEDLNELKIVQNDFENLKVYLNNSYNENEFYIKDIVAMGTYVIDELSLRSHIQSLPNIINELWEIMGESGEAIRNSLLWILETIKNAYQKVSEIISAILKGDSMNQIANIVEKFIMKYDMFVKDLHVSTIKYIEYLYHKIYQSINLQWNRFLMQVEPIFIQLAHYLETVGWKAVQEFFNFLYDRKVELITSPYYDHFSNFTQDIDKFYRDLKANDIITNIEHYSASVVQFIKERYFAFVPFSNELKDVIDEICTELMELRKLPSVKYTFEKIQQVYDRINYFYKYFEIRAKLENAVRLIHSNIMDVSQTALQADSRYREAKTKFIYDPNHGFMCLEQKLPMSWHAFNQTPEFHEIPEYRAIADMRSYFTTSNATFWTMYYRIKPLTEPANWLPPFKGQAMIIGRHHFKTFDNRHFEFLGTCTYLAASDFVHDSFALLVKYGQNTTLPMHQIIILVENDAIELDIFQDSVKIIGNSEVLQMPIELDNGTLFIYREKSILTVEHKNRQFKVECNLKFDFCIIELGGWYFGKTAGLLGTMNNEIFDDILSSKGNVEMNINKFFQSWSLECSSDAGSLINIQQSQNELGFCRELFTNKSSDFSSCFSIVDPDAYQRMCLNSVNEQEACAVAIAYLHSCMFHDTYLRIPSKCTTCNTDNSEIPEGDVRKLEGEAIPMSSDIVFIVEAKECNRNLRKNRSIDQLVANINKELIDNHLVNNHWSLVIFGGDSVYDAPRSLILNNKIFVNQYSEFTEYFEHIPIGNGNTDVFEALRFATQLAFRAGVSKTFILMPCSHCESEKQSLDYSVLFHALQERGIVLHILMSGEFQLEKSRLNKIFYGFDATRSFTKKDSRVLIGDTQLRRQVKLSKSALGYCIPLSLESNGTIFTGSKLQLLEKPTVIKKFISVFAKRLVLTAQPKSCQYCECVANNDGISKMECTPCDYPAPVTVQFVNETFDEDDVRILQSSNEDSDQDIDEE